MQAAPMVVCASCGAENAERQRYCGSCAAPLEADEERQRQRKTVTVVFCDVVGSTALGELRDPEAVERLLATYFRRMRGIVGSHGGTVEKFIGDAVVAVFGVPVAHEDDALRALRAAMEMRDAFPQLGIEGRVGVNTGEIVTSGHGTIVTGDAVNVAARLEQAAAAGEILVGAQTVALAGVAAAVEELEPLNLRGKADPVAAFRLAGVASTAGRPHGGRFVGRLQELSLLRDAWGRTFNEGRCEVVTIVGEPGVGKSRLVEELVAGLQTRVVRGRCLSYGEGITYFPVLEVIKQLNSPPGESTATGALRSLLGDSDVPTSANEIAWAFRELLEQAAPLLVVFDDIQWGEETFLDLIEHVALASTGRPLMVLCLARPELVERRPWWPIALKLDPLPPVDVEALLPEALSESVRERIIRAAGGNPLFLIEMVAFAGEVGDEVVVPPTLKALLGARLDQLETPERDVLQRGAVEGELFHRGAVQALAPSEVQVARRLTALVRKELIRPDQPVFLADDGFRFCHLLIRDAAYEALPKATRAELHQRFAGWLDRHGSDFVERDEITGYHLEQAYRYTTDLGSRDQAAEALAIRAAGHLVAAARRARDRLDRFAAISLFERAARLDPAGRNSLLPQIAELHFMVGHFPKALALLDETMRSAHESGDKATEALAAVVRAAAAVQSGDPAVPLNKAMEICQRATGVLEDVGNDEQLAQALHHVGGIRFNLGHADQAGRDFQSALNHARLAGDLSLSRACLGGILSTKAVGPTPVSEFFTFLNGITPELQPLLAGSRFYIAHMAAYSGDFAKAHDEYAEAQRFATQFANPVISAALTMVLGMIELIADDPVAAECTLRDGYERLDRLGARGVGVKSATHLAEALCRQNRDEEAIQILDAADEITLRDDFDPRVRSRSVRAQILAKRGHLEEADRLSREALDIISATDAVVLHGETLLSRAKVLQASGSRQEAQVALRQALKLFELKENVVQADQTRALLATAGAPIQGGEAVI